MSKESRAIEELMAGGMSRREANHLVKDEGLSSAKFRQARTQAAQKVSARKAAKAARVGRAEAERPRRSFWGSRGNRREW
jgi:uncharacterized protein YoaH (UPF0181 family)